MQPQRRAGAEVGRQNKCSSEGKINPITVILSEAKDLYRSKHAL
jgi:hypothetical protein